MLVVKASPHATHDTMPVLVSQSIVQPTVLSPLQNGQLNCVSSFAAAFLGGGLALLFRLPMAGWQVAAALVRDLGCPQQPVNQPTGCRLRGAGREKDSSDQILLTGWWARGLVMS